jgi:hypothetical protein
MIPATALATATRIAASQVVPQYVQAFPIILKLAEGLSIPDLGGSCQSFVRHREEALLKFYNEMLTQAQQLEDAADAYEAAEKGLTID